MDITTRIKTLRTKKGLKQADMAEKLQMERSNYSRLENRGNDLTFSQIEQIAKAMGVSTLELLYPTQFRKLGYTEALEEENAILTNSIGKVQALFSVIMQLGEGMQGLGLNEEKLKAMLDPDGRLEQLAKEKFASLEDDSEQE